MGAKILFADDDPLMQKFYGRYIERAGFELVEATNGREAVEAAVREKPQLAVVDIVMPEMDGLSAMLELKNEESTKGIPVVMISADPNYYLHKEQILAAGAAIFLTKPFSPAQLLGTIQRLLPQADGGG